MLDIPVTAHIEITQAQHGLTVQAFITAAPPRPLHWHLKLTSQNSGGTNSITQGGAVSGDKTGAVGTINVSRNSQGAATLLVFDGEREVARDTIDFKGEAVAATP